MKWSNIFRGMLMGITDLVPGVSGGTIALVLGIYHELIAAINGILSRQWKKNIWFLIPLGIGILISLFIFSRLIEWLVNDYPQLTFFFFLGLVVGVIPFLMIKIDFKKSFKYNHYMLLGFATIVVAITTFIREEGIGEVMSNLSTFDYLFLFIAGWLASSAMILPGISGSFILLLLGVLPTMYSALKNFSFDIIFVVGLGVVVGLIVTSKILNYILIHFTIGTYAVIIGLVLGSTFVIFPGFPEGILLITFSLILFIAGYLTSTVLSYKERRNREKMM
jgi:putative membrane protein